MGQMTYNFITPNVDAAKVTFDRTYEAYGALVSYALFFPPFYSILQKNLVCIVY